MVKREITSSAVITFDPREGFLRITSNAVEEFSIEDTRRDFWLAADMVNHQAVPVLADSREYTNASPEVRDFYAGKEASERILAMAIVVGSIATRLIGNFFIRVNKPAYPVRLFNTLADAEKWIQLFVPRPVQAGAHSSSL